MRIKNIIDKCINKLESKRDRELREWHIKHLLKLESEGKLNESR